VLYFDSLEYKA